MAKEASQRLSGLGLAGGPGSGGQSVASLAIFRDPDDLDDQGDFLLRCLQIGTTRRMSLLNRIFARCKREGDCLIWQGPHSGNGRGGEYGRFSFEGVTAAVHIAVYELVYGPVPPKKQVDHSCKKRLCCNPFHLRHMTHKKNQKLREKRNAGPKRNLRYRDDGLRQEHPVAAEHPAQDH